jgi:hypothetical protein
MNAKTRDSCGELFKNLKILPMSEISGTDSEMQVFTLLVALFSKLTLPLICFKFMEYAEEVCMKLIVCAKVD